MTLFQALPRTIMALALVFGLAAQGQAQAPEEFTLSGQGGGDSGKIALSQGKKKLLFDFQGVGNCSMRLVDAKGKVMDVIVDDEGPVSGEKVTIVKSAGEYVVSVTTNGRWSVTVIDRLRAMMRDDAERRGRPMPRLRASLNATVESAEANATGGATTEATAKMRKPGQEVWRVQAGSAVRLKEVFNGAKLAFKGRCRTETGDWEVKSLQFNYIKEIRNHKNGKFTVVDIFGKAFSLENCIIFHPVRFVVSKDNEPERTSFLGVFAPVLFYLDKEQSDPGAEYRLGTDTFDKIIVEDRYTLIVI